MHPYQRLVVFDFDGTCTDAEEEGKGFVAAVIATLSLLTSRLESTIRALYDEIEQQILAEPSKYDWVIDGIAVCPGTLDPYLRSSHVARKLLANLGYSEADVIKIMRIVGERFNDHYTQGGIAIRPGIPDLLRDIKAEPNLALAIVTNSNTRAVWGKLIKAFWPTSFDFTTIRVVGGAKKYVIGDASIVPESEIPREMMEGFGNVPETLNIKGLHRPVQLRRPYYYGTINKLCIEAGVSQENVTVIGDVVEMDLILPHALGSRFGCAVNSHTPDYELAYIGRYPMGALLHTVDDMRRFVFEG